MADTVSLTGMSKTLLAITLSFTNLLYRHYFYRLRGEYAVPRTPKSGRGWGFRPVIRHVSVEEKDVPRVFYPGSTKVKPRKRLVLSQTLIIDVDPAKVSSLVHKAFPYSNNVFNVLRKATKRKWSFCIMT